MADNSSFKKVWDQLLDAFPQSATRPGTVTIYTKMLADIACDDLLKVVEDGIATEWRFTRMPTIAEIRQHWTALRVRALGVPSGVEAWGEVLAQLHPYRMPKFSTELIKQAVRAIGWNLLIQAENEQMFTHRARFVEVYETLLERAKHSATMTPAVRDSGLGRDGRELAGKVAAKLSLPGSIAPGMKPARSKPKHTVYRQATAAEIAANDYIHNDDHASSLAHPGRTCRVLRGARYWSRARPHGAADCDGDEHSR